MKVVLWPDQAIPLAGYICHPNDPAAREELLGTLKSWSDGSETAITSKPGTLIGDLSSVSRSGTRHQRCWVHKTANVLNKVALSVQVNMKVDLREIYGAPTRAAAEVAIDVLADKYNAKYDKAVARLTKDREALLAFFDFPAEHWDHLRTSNPIESVFATVRHRTVRTKGSATPPGRMPSSTTARVACMASYRLRLCFIAICVRSARLPDHQPVSRSRACVRRNRGSGLVLVVAVFTIAAMAPGHSTRRAKIVDCII
jgi:hypothetical protein